jgi:hypothetical protein
MLDPTELYQVEDNVNEALRPTGEPTNTDEPRVLLHHLSGYIDAGHAGRLAVDHLLSALPNTLVATFDVDQLLDYRSRRPTMTFDGDHWAEYDEPVLGIYAMRDLTGTPFLLLTGPEPDTQWERFASAVGELVERLDVDLTVGMAAIPMAVPHTRPAGVTAHGTRRELISRRIARAAARAGRARRNGPGRTRAALPGRDRVPDRRTYAARPHQREHRADLAH